MRIAVLPVPGRRNRRMAAACRALPSRVNTAPTPANQVEDICTLPATAGPRQHGESG